MRISRINDFLFENCILLGFLVIFSVFLVAIFTADHNQVPSEITYYSDMKLVEKNSKYVGKTTYYYATFENDKITNFKIRISGGLYNDIIIGEHFGLAMDTERNNLYRIWRWQK